MADQRPRIKVVNKTGMAHDTQVFTANGTEISNAITEIHLHMEIGKMNTAEVKAILLGTEIDAVITDLQTKVLPPPVPKTQYRFCITEGSETADVWSLEVIYPLPTYGVKEDFLAGGAIAKGIGPLEIVADAE